MNRKRVQPAPGGSSSAMTLRIYEPPGVHDMPGMGYSLKGPEVAPCLINGTPCNLRDWTQDEWACLPTEMRPRNAFRGDRGSWYTIDPDS
jgi:hypothetical protein